MKNTTSTHLVLQVLVAVLILSASPAYSLSLSSLLSPLTDVITTKNNNFIKLTPARIPEDLEGIRDCRKSMERSRIGNALLDSERMFLNADNVRDKKLVCFVAKETIYPWRVLGSADIKTRDDEATIYNVLVRPEFRGRGLGRRIMDGAQSFVEESGDATKVSLYVYVQNTPAFKLYSQLGYTSPGVHAAVSLLSESTGLNLQVKMTKDLVVNVGAISSSTNSRAEYFSFLRV
jgi:ribosomal protein S18 acetylase RimI-like enzyme